MKIYNCDKPKNVEYCSLVPFVFVTQYVKELIQFFLLTRENNIDILETRGSYAGAMGYGQFISSSYRAYAIDYDGDENADLFNSVEDAIGSIANYLKYIVNI